MRLSINAIQHVVFRDRRRRLSRFRVEDGVRFRVDEVDESGCNLFVPFFGADFGGAGFGGAVACLGEMAVVLVLICCGWAGESVVDSRGSFWDWRGECWEHEDAVEGLCWRCEVF